ncbi:MAG: class I SAM-dependent methyltransferase [Chloroflexia bacterium]|nr:class I SAM-dependent methyltransferase [Chloroflexia bacterium]
MTKHKGQHVNPWDEYADEYEQWLSDREPGHLVDTTFPDLLLDLLGDLAGKTVLDAGCGQGYLSRMLAARGARVTGIDLSPRLIAKARKRDTEGVIDYRLADLSQPLPKLERHFDLIGSFLVLNDVRDYRGFAATLASLAKPGARIVLGFNNPYSSVVREHITDYFAEGAMGTYFGLWEQGIRARYYHRTLEQYLDAFFDAGLRLIKLVDVPDVFGIEWVLPKGSRFPRFLILAFEKP